MRNEIVYRIRPCFRCTVNHWAVDMVSIFGKYYTIDKTWYFKTEEDAKSFKQKKEK